MKVEQLRINGVDRPMGYALDTITCAWKVTGANGKKQTRVKIEISTQPDLDAPCFQKEGEDLCSAGETLDFAPEKKTRYFYRVTAETDAGETASGVSWFETGKCGDWRAKWITAPDTKGLPVFTRTFSAEKPIRQARLYGSGLGLYEARINGACVTEEHLLPLTSDYTRRIQYQTFDVKALLQKENQIEIACGNGWYKGRLGYEGDREVYGSSFAVIAELEVRFGDGTSLWLGTDESWQVYGSDVGASDLYDGEILNRLLHEQRQWYPAAVSRELSVRLLTERNSLPVLAHEELGVREVIRTPAGERVLDFGQNLAGYVSFSSAGLARGTKVTLDFGEILQDGNFYNANYRTAKAQYVYVADGREETVRPWFTFYGFRYVRVSGWEGEFTPENWKAHALYSDLPQTGWLTTSHPKLNRLLQNVEWGLQSNFIDLPTDCPQRDERLGWTGDAQVFAPTACYLRNTAAFYRKYLEDLHAEQQKWDGAVPNFIPNYPNKKGGAAIWGDAAVFLPMTLYEFYGDKQQLRRDYPMMREWADYLTRESEANHTAPLIEFGMQFGDWLAMDGITEQSFKGGTDEYFLASAYYYASVQKTKKAAEILNFAEDAAVYGALSGKILSAILDEYFSVNGRLCIDTQAAYVVCLRFGIYRKKERLLEGFRERLRKDCWKIRCGFAGAPVLCQTLGENGMGDLANRILFYEGFPGWLRCVNLGATTVWERWNSVLDDGRISGTAMNSLNHYAYGSVAEYLYRQVAGIAPLAPGFRRARILPHPDYRLRELSCRFDSAYGTYALSWLLKEDGSIELSVSVPFGAEAELFLPGTEEKRELTAGTYRYAYKPEKNFLQPFSADSLLSELANSPQAMETLREQIPVAAQMAVSSDVESRSLRLRDLLAMPYMGFETSSVQTAIQKIETITIQEGEKSV